MGSSAKNFVRGSLLLSLLLYGWSLVQPTAATSQDSPEGAILDHALKEAAQELQVQKKEQARAQKQIQRKQRSTREFEALLAKARQQHARIKQWQKGRSTELKIYSTSAHKKRRLLIATLLSR
jgi:ATPase subunit of ABC transporter with duplicated ATPase domains